MTIMKPCSTALTEICLPPPIFGHFFYLGRESATIKVLVDKKYAVENTHKVQKNVSEKFLSDLSVSLGVSFSIVVPNPSSSNIPLRSQNV